MDGACNSHGGYKKYKILLENKTRDDREGFSYICKDNIKLDRNELCEDDWSHLVHDKTQRWVLMNTNMNFGFRDWAASNDENYPTFRQNCSCHFYQSAPLIPTLLLLLPAVERLPKKKVRPLRIYPEGVNCSPCRNVG